MLSLKLIRELGAFLLRGLLLLLSVLILKEILINYYKFRMIGCYNCWGNKINMNFTK